MAQPGQPKVEIQIGNLSPAPRSQFARAFAISFRESRVSRAGQALFKVAGAALAYPCFRGAVPWLWSLKEPETTRFLLRFKLVKPLSSLGVNTG